MSFKRSSKFNNLFLAVALMFSVVTFSAMGEESQASLIQNGDFSEGLNGWRSNGVEVFDTGIEGFDEVAVIDTSRSWGWERLGQSLTIPVETTQINISFDYLFAGKDENIFLDDLAYANFGYIVEDNLHNLCSFDDWHVERLFLDTSSGDQFNQVVHFSTTVDISGIADLDPNAGIVFALIETGRGTNTRLFLDNVTANAVPLPPAVILLASGFLGVVTYRKKRRN